MKKTYKYLLGVLLLVLSFFFFKAEFNREYISIPSEEGEVSALKLEMGTVYRQSFIATRYSISQLSLPLRPAIAAPSKALSIEIIVFKEGERVRVQQINPSFINKENSVRVQFDPPIATAPNEEISFSLTVPSGLSGHYRLQLPSVEEAQVISSSFYIDDQLQERSLAFKVFYTFRSPLAYQVGMFLLLGAVLLITNLPIKSKAAFVLYTVVLSAVFVSPGVALGYFSPWLLLFFIIGFVGMFLWLRALKLPLLATLAGAHVFVFTTYFPLHNFVGREKMLVFAFLPLVFLIFYPTTRFIKKHLKVSLFVLFIILLFVILLPYQVPPVKPVHVADLKDIFFDPNQIPIPDRFDAAYYTWLLPQGDPPVIELYGGWDNFGSYVGLINVVLAIVGVLAAVKRHWRLTLIGLASLVFSASEYLTPILSSFMPVPPQYFIVLVTFILATFTAIGLASLRSFLGKDRLTKIIIISIVVIALLDLLNVSSKTLQFGLL